MGWGGGIGTYEDGTGHAKSVCSISKVPSAEVNHFKAWLWLYPVHIYREMSAFHKKSNYKQLTATKKRSFVLFFCLKFRWLEGIAETGNGVPHGKQHRERERERKLHIGILLGDQNICMSEFVCD